MIVRVRTKQERRVGPEERLVVMRPLGESRIDYALTNAGPEVHLAEVVRAQRQRHRIEECLVPARERSGSIITRSGVGWAGTIT